LLFVVGGLLAAAVLAATAGGFLGRGCVGRLRGYGTRRLKVGGDGERQAGVRIRQQIGRQAHESNQTWPKLPHRHQSHQIDAQTAWQIPQSWFHHFLRQILSGSISFSKDFSSTGSTARGAFSTLLVLDGMLVEA
jgi:hypothetical protein